MAVVGLLLAVAVTITADAWLRRRGRSKTAAAAVVPTVAAPPPPLPSLFEPPPAATETVPLVMTRLFRATPSNGNAVRAASERASSGPGSAETVVNGSRAVPYDPPPDATVILPRTIPAVDE